MSTGVRKRYELPNGLRYERLRGCKFTCEECGKKTTSLESHHIISCYLASRNEILTSAIIKSIANIMCLCKNCHTIADQDQLSWTPRDIAMIAWALFDLDPNKVEEYQNGTYANIYDKSKSKRKERKRRRKMRRTPKKNSSKYYLVS